MYVVLGILLGTLCMLFWLIYTTINEDVCFTYVLGSYCCCNKLTRTSCLKQQIYYLKSEAQNGSYWGLTGLHSFLEVLGKNLFPCLVQLLEAAGIRWLPGPLPLRS